MKNRTWIISGFTLIAMTLLIVYDFFPKLNGFIQIPKPVFIGFVLLTLFSGIFFNRNNKSESSVKSDLIRQVIFTSYLIVLILVFTLLGGNSQVGISLSNPFLWIALMITVYDHMKQYKKMKSAKISVVSVHKTP